MCDSPQCPGSRVTQSWVRRGPHCRGDGVRRQPVRFPRWANWSISPWWKPQGEPGVKRTLGGDTKDRQGAALLAELIRRRPGGTLGSLLPQHAPPGSPTGSHPPADGRVHLLPGAGKDSATAAEHPAQAVHPGSAPGGGTGGGGTILAGHGGDIIIVPWGQGGTLYPDQPESGDVSILLARQRAPFNLASHTWQGEKGWGAIFHYFHPFGVLGIAW